MLLGTLINVGLKEIWAHKAKSFLTMLGIMIGIMAVILINSVGSGAQSLIFSQLSSLGTNIVGVLPGKSDQSAGPPAAAQGIVITTLTAEDALALENDARLPYVLYSGLYVRGTGSISYSNKDISTSFSGTRANKNLIEDAQVQLGRYFTEEEAKNLGKVIVLGSEIKKELFGDQNPLGKKVKIKNQVFTVIGVMETRGQAAFQNQDTEVYLPYSTVQKLLLGINHINFIRAKVDAPEHIPQSIDTIKIILRERHKVYSAEDDDFTVLSSVQRLEVLSSVTNGIKFFLASVAAISLIVGGIGIMNIMLIIIRQRTREIGLRKAVGARRRDILWQFLIESVLLTSLGGLLGIVFGAFLSWVVAQIAISQGYSWQYIVSPDAVLTAFAIASAIGMFFGLYPAYRAAKLDPIIALRYE